MDRQLTAKDIQKTVLAVCVLLTLCGAGWFSVQKSGLQREERRMSQQMQREAQLVPEAPVLRSRGETRLTEQMNREAELVPQTPVSTEETEPSAETR